MRRQYYIYVLCIILVLFIAGCASSADPDENETAISDDLIQVTKQQFETNNMKIGEVSLRPFVETLSVNGYIESPPNGMAFISTQITGVVKAIYFSVGDHVTKGQVLCMVSSTELIELQQDFAETASGLIKLKADWERSKALFEENIGAEKNFKTIESQYLITKAKYQSLKLRLELLDLNTSKIEEGELFAAFPVKAPISGFVTNQHIVIGQFVEPQLKLMEIVNVGQLHLKLSVFENDIQRIKIGQDVEFKSMGEAGSIHFAYITSIGKTINSKTKTINCIAKIRKEADLSFINNTYVEAKVFVDQIEANALPSDAILKSNQKYFVLVLENSDDQNYLLKKIKVDVGRVSDGFTEIQNAEGLSKVITQGVYNLNLE